MIGVAGDAVSILGEYDRDAARFDQVPNPLQPRTLQDSAGVSAVYALLNHFVTLFGGVLSQAFYLLIQGKSLSDLLLGANPRIEDHPLALLSIFHLALLSIRMTFLDGTFICYRMLFTWSITRFS